VSKSAVEELFAAQVRAAGLPEPEREVRFHPKRKWRADFAWMDAALLVELDGGEWVRGRHCTGSGMAKDNEKRNAATLAGWKLLVYTGSQVRDGSAIREVTHALRGGKSCGSTDC
jgi:very-short-patch-repair endonuclease